MRLNQCYTLYQSAIDVANLTSIHCFLTTSKSVALFIVSKLCKVATCLWERLAINLMSAFLPGWAQLIIAGDTKQINRCWAATETTTTSTTTTTTTTAATATTAAAPMTAKKLERIRFFRPSQQKTPFWIFFQSVIVHLNLFPNFPFFVFHST